MTVDIESSSIVWTFARTEVTDWGKVKLKSAQIFRDKKSGKILSSKIIIDMNSLELKDVHPWQVNAFKNDIQKMNFFYLKKWPQAYIIVQDMNFDKGVAKAILKIRNIEKEFLIPFQKHKNIFKGQFTFDLLDFGVIWRSDKYYKGNGVMSKSKVLINYRIVTKL